MALEKIVPNDRRARQKMDAAFDAIDALQSKADGDALAAEIEQREADRAAATESDAALSERIDAVDERIDTVNDRVDARAETFELVVDSHRPGEPGRFATEAIAGTPEAVPPLMGNRVVSLKQGAVIAIGNGQIAPRGVQRIEPGRQYRLRFVLQRARDTEDPANDAIRLGIAWLKADKSLLTAEPLIDAVDITVASGRLEFSYVVARVNAEGVDKVAPTNAVYARPYIRCFGDGLTHVEVIGWEDLSLATNWSPDVSEFRRALAGLDQRAADTAAQLDELVQGFTAAQERAAQSAFGEIAVDANVVIRATADARTIRHSATLTATRQVALVEAGAVTGSPLRIVRSGAGAFPLDVGPGLKAMPSGSWADFMFDGAAWFLAASGSL